MLGERCMSSNAIVADMGTRAARTNAETDLGPGPTVNGTGRYSLSKNFGSENQVDMTIPMFSYARASFLYWRISVAPLVGA
jgi:hypothetical protein